MSHRLVDERRDRINLMLECGEKETQSQIEEFDEQRKKNKNYILKAAFETLTWLNTEKFLARMALNLGNRARILKEYFNILEKAQKFQVHPRNSKLFRAIKPIEKYLIKNPIN